MHCQQRCIPTGSLNPRSQLQQHNNVNDTRSINSSKSQPCTKKQGNYCKKISLSGKKGSAEPAAKNAHHNDADA
ncbi:hypothetical protein M8C21_019584 [Ambrosia artemisiifolia]|uniref:Uncharacterized protein n=1 Tax=Ambrosia artemisiifolia TaxID=4212 RepID=A0AAD5GMA4_AMBAR|nr:hypothetical protein M8C21_019584 [Ambrosia artemisiifolia]